MEINKKLTAYNYSRRNDTERIKYIVIHYFGSLATAKNLADYWAGKYVGASAHYAVGHDGDVYQCVADGDIAWHCGAKAYRHPACRNSNSIGIEMAVYKQNTKTMNASDRDWYFSPETMEAAAGLVRGLMETYHVPVGNVLRHHDVTGKTCPAPFVHDSAAWESFKRALSGPAVSGGGQETVPGELYRIRRTWTSPNSQLGAYRNLEGAIQNCPAGYRVYNMAGKAVYDPESGSSERGYQVRINNCSALNIRKEPSAGGKITGVIRDSKKYTVVEEKNGWGRLESGAGWIKLSYTRKV